jgi:uncharacterized membrane-anchored protein YitT (DUF2179 family)
MVLVWCVYLLSAYLNLYLLDYEFSLIKICTKKKKMQMENILNNAYEMGINCYDQL